MSISTVSDSVDVAGYARLRMAAEMYFDHQQLRISQANRVRSLTVLPESFVGYVREQQAEETKLARMMVEQMREVAPSGVLAWQLQTLGVGEHMLARLLGHLGHPRIALPQFWVENPTLEEGELGDEANPRRALHTGEPFERTVGQLWQYCGHGRAGRRRAGMSQADAFALGNPRCKMLVHLIAEAVKKAGVRAQCADGNRFVAVKGDVCECGAKRADHVRVGLSPLAEFYLAEKAKYLMRVHSGPCSGGHVSRPDGRVLFVRCKVSTPAKNHPSNHAAGAGVDTLPTDLPTTAPPNPQSRGVGASVPSPTKIHTKPNAAASVGERRYAEAGDPYQPGHVDAIATRHLGKRILLELWLASA